MKSSLFIFAALIFFALVWWCKRAEKKSRKWYSDRALIFAAGFFFNAGLVMLSMAVVFFL